MRYHGTNSDGEILSSAYIDRSDCSDPSFGLDCSNLPSLTRQEFADECNINILMEKYEKTGIISHVNPRNPQYLDLSDVPDLMTAHQIIQTATTEFMALPAKVRCDFDNDPMAFVKFAENPDNIGKMREWGLAPPEEAPPAPAMPPKAASDAPAASPPPSDNSAGK